MPRSKVQLAAVVLLFLAGSVCPAAEPAGAISGIVRDAQGVPQMGALVQVIGANATVMARALTDLRGRYRIMDLLPGRYQVRASATLFAPALRNNLELRSGGRTVVNLTLGGIFDATAWLPMQRRRLDEPRDDWTWTLRSAANRPILRMVDDGGVVFASSSATQQRTQPMVRETAVSTGDGGFGSGGVHHSFRSSRDTDAKQGRMALYADVAGVRTPYGSGLSTQTSATLERRLVNVSQSRATLRYQSHPEMLGSFGAAGYDAVQLATAEKMIFGDFAEMEIGSALDGIHASGYVAIAHPFFRLAIHPTSSWTAGYALATSRGLQSLDSMDSPEADLPVAVAQHGRLRTEKGSHQEIYGEHRSHGRMVRFSLHRDAVVRLAIAGGGNTGSAAPVLATSMAQGIVADAATGNFRILSGAYRSQGWDAVVTQALAPGLWLAAQFDTGSALAFDDADSAPRLRPETSQSATLALHGRLPQGIKVRAAYRWQPEHTVTPVSAYEAFSDEAYLSFHLRQPIRCGQILPSGAVLNIDISNMLAQGYRPFVSQDGQTLFLAEAPRSLQAGIAFSF